MRRSPTPFQSLQADHEVMDETEPGGGVSGRGEEVLRRVRATPPGFVRTYGDVSPGAPVPLPEETPERVVTLVEHRPQSEADEIYRTADLVVDQLLSGDLWTGWGIRTMASDAAAFL